MRSTAASSEAKLVSSSSKSVDVLETRRHGECRGDEDKSVDVPKATSLPKVTKWVGVSTSKPTKWVGVPTSKPSEGVAETKIVGGCPEGDQPGEGD